MSTAERFKRYEQDRGQLFPAHLSEGLAKLGVVRDIGELMPMADQIKANTGERAGWLLADNGSSSERGLRDLKRRRRKCLIAAGREGKKPGRRAKVKWASRMERTLRLPWAKQCYARRKTRGEWALVCSAFNLRRMMALAPAAA